MTLLKFFLSGCIKEFLLDGRLTDFLHSARQRHAVTPGCPLGTPTAPTTPTALTTPSAPPPPASRHGGQDKTMALVCTQIFQETEAVVSFSECSRLSGLMSCPETLRSCRPARLHSPGERAGTTLTC